MTDYYYIAPEEYTIRKKTTGKIEKGLKRLLIIAAVIFAAQLIWLFGITPFIPFSTIEVHGFSGLQRTEILSIAGINENSSFVSTNTREIQNKLSAYVLVESAVVMKRFPDKLSIFLTPREAAAVTIATVGNRQIPMYIDRHGVIFKVGEAELLETRHLPVLSGIGNPRLNMRLPDALVPLVESLCEISSASPELLSAISEIRIERKAWDGYDMVLFPVHSSIRVRVNYLTEDVLRYVLLMLNVFENDIQKPNEIDFRSGMGAYKLKEQAL